MQLPCAASNATVLGVAFAAIVFAAAQSVPEQHPPDALELLRNVEATYAAMGTYSGKSTHVMDMSGPSMQNKMEIATTIAADSSGRFRIESTGMMDMLMVSDGTTMWMYMPQLNQYSRFSAAQAQAAASGGRTDASEAAAAVSSEGGMGMFGSGNPLYGYRSLSSNVKDAEILRSEKLHVGGSDMDCWVVLVEYEFPAGSPAHRTMEAHSDKATMGFSFEPARTKTLWVDQARYLIYQEDSTSKMTMPGASGPINTRDTVKFESITVDEPISPEVFTFTPPAGATEMDTSKEIERIKRLQKTTPN